MCGTKCAREQDACLSLLARTVQGMGQESYTLVEESIERTPVVAHNRAWYPAKMSGHQCHSPLFASCQRMRRTNRGHPGWETLADEILYRYEN
jgi:hypothetical protein